MTEDYDAIVVYRSGDDAYGRRVEVRRYEFGCDSCGGGPALDINTSQGEYLSFWCCGPCFIALLGAPFLPKEPGAGCYSFPT